MGKRTKYVVLALEFEDDNAEPPYIKDWWVRQHAEKMVSAGIDYMRSRISNVSVSYTVKMLPEEVVLSVEAIIDKEAH